MSRPKVLYFTAAAAPTGPEQAAIDALLAGQYDVQVRNAAQSALYGTKAEPCDFKAGSAPAEYDDVPVWDAGALLPSTSAIVSDAQELTVGGSTYTFTVVDGAITAIAVA